MLYAFGTMSSETPTGPTPDRSEVVAAQTPPRRSSKSLSGESHLTDSAKAGASEFGKNADPSLGEVFRRLGPAGYLAIGWASLPVLGSLLLWLNIGSLASWLRSHDQFGFLLYVVIFMCSAGFGILPTYLQAILGGWAFGVVLGIPGAILGVTGASLIGYLAARMASDNRAERMIAENAKARAVSKALIGHSFWKTLGIVTLLRVPINSPFAITNLVMASAGVPKRIFLIGTAVGMAPRTALAVYLAAGVRDLTLTKEVVKEARPAWVVYASIASAVVVFWIVATICSRAIKKVTAGIESAHEST